MSKKKRSRQDTANDVSRSVMEISEDDIEALARMAYHEAKNIADDIGDERAAYGSIVDAILNRTATGAKYLGASNNALMAGFSDWHLALTTPTY